MPPSRPDPPSGPPPSDPPPLRRGQLVRVLSLRRVGRVMTVDTERRRAEIEINGKIWTIALGDLSTEADARDELAPPSTVRPAMPVTHVLDLHGMLVEEAVEAVDKFLDSALINELESVKIVHGHGSGRVREAVRKLLASHPHVADFHFGAPWQGGPAATIVRFR